MTRTNSMKIRKPFRATLASLTTLTALTALTTLGLGMFTPSANAQTADETREAVKKRIEALRAQRAELEKTLEAADQAKEAPKKSKEDDAAAAEDAKADKLEVEVKGGKGAKVAAAKIKVLQAPVPIRKSINEKIVLDNFVMDPKQYKDGASVFLEYAADVDIPVKKDTLNLMSKDNQLSGTMKGISEDGKVLIWEHDAVEQSIPFNLKGVSTVELQPREMESKEHKSAIRLTNGDFLVGDISSMDEKQMVLDTWYGGQLNVKREMISAINPAANSTMLVYEGPTDEQGWSHGSGKKTWMVRNGGLYSQRSGTVGRLFNDMPDKVRIDFTAQWQSYPYFSFAFATDEIKRRRGANYTLQIQNSRIQMTRNTEEDSGNRVWDLPTSNSRDRTKVEYSIFYDRVEKNILFMMDGRLMKDWTDPNDFAGGGSGIMFYSQNSNPMKISNIKVSQWNGKKPEESASEDEVSEDMDIVYFINGDRMIGKVLGITDGTLSLKIDFGPVKIALDRITEISLGEEAMERARRRKGDLRAMFTERGSITVELLGMEGDTLKGRSGNFGDIQLPLNAFKQVEFNIYKKKVETEDVEFDFGF